MASILGSETRLQGGNFEMLSRLGEGASGEKCSEELERWLSALEERVTILKTFTTSSEAKW